MRVGMGFVGEEGGVTLRSVCVKFGVWVLVLGFAACALGGERGCAAGAAEYACGACLESVVSGV